jgi:predicted Zn-dependent protease
MKRNHPAGRQLIGEPVEIRTDERGRGEGAVHGHPWCSCPRPLSRREFCRGALAAGVVVAAAPLLAQEAVADAFMPSAKDQIQAGNQAAAEVKRKYRIVNDERARFLETLGRRLESGLSSEERGPWDYRFNVIDSKEVNAFALPGGPIFMFTGLYDRIRTEDELAAVTGQEMTHVRKQHWAHMVADQTKRQLGLSVLLGLTRAGGGWRQAAGLTDALLTLRYSRKDEDQADQGGLQDMVAAGYNPKGMLDLFQTLQSSGGDGGTPGFLRDHPLTKDRISHTEDRIQELGGRSFRPEVPLPFRTHG